MLLLETPFSTRFDVSKPPCSETFQRPPVSSHLLPVPTARSLAIPTPARPPWLPASGSPTALNPPGLRPRSSLSCGPASHSFPLDLTLQTTLRSAFVPLAGQRAREERAWGALCRGDGLHPTMLAGRKARGAGLCLRETRLRAEGWWGDHTREGRHRALYEQTEQKQGRERQGDGRDAKGGRCSAEQARGIPVPASGTFRNTS